MPGLVNSSQYWGVSSQLNTSSSLDTLSRFFASPDFARIYTIEEPDALGRLGRNKEYQMYSSPLWQQNVNLYAIRSLINRDVAKIDLAIKAIEFGFSRQLSNGDFAFVPIPGIPEELQRDVGFDGHSGKRGETFFLASVGSSLEAFAESQWFQTASETQGFRERLEALKPKLKSALDCLVAEKMVMLEQDSKATNRIWFTALAFYGNAKFIGDTDHQQWGLHFARKAMSQYIPETGIFLENGGGDTQYQGVNLINASMFNFLLAKGDPLSAQIRQAIAGGTRWLQSKTLSTGEISTEGNTRVYDGGESCLGNEKNIDYKPAILAFSLGGFISNDQSFLDTGSKVTDFSLPGMLSFSAPVFSVNEDGTKVLAVQVTRQFGAKGAVGASIALSNGTARSSDYNPTQISFAFADGEMGSKSIEVPVIQDSIYEGIETVNLRLRAAVGGAVIGNQGTATMMILDDDINPSMKSYRFEGEMADSITGFGLEPLKAASGGQSLALNVGSDSGSATFMFQGVTGAYDIVLGTFDENDGAAQFSVSRNGASVGSVTLDQDLGSSAPNSRTRVRRAVAARVSLGQGDIVRVDGFKNGGELARLDFIDLVQVPVI